MSTRGRETTASSRSSSRGAEAPDTPLQSYRLASRLTSPPRIAAPISPTSWLSTRGQPLLNMRAPSTAVALGSRAVAPIASHFWSVYTARPSAPMQRWTVCAFACAGMHEARQADRAASTGNGGERIPRA